MSVKNENSMKQENMQRLWRLLYGVERATVAQLAEWSGLSVVTTTALVKELVRLGQAEQDSIIQPQLGRPAAAYRFAAQYKLVLIVYMLEHQQQDCAYFSVCDLRGQSLHAVKETLHDPSADSFDDTIAALLLQYPRISGIGFGLPVGSELQGRLVASDYPSLQNIPLRTHIIERFGLPTVFVNDINAAAFGYCKAHRLEGQCVISMFFPYKYTPGAGICCNGQLLPGRDGLAGACQHLPYGEDWQKYRDDPQGQSKIVVKVLKMAQCLLNPHTIVLYWDRPAPDIAALLRQDCHSETETIMIPELVVSDQMEADFRHGLIHLTLDILLNPG